VRHQREFFASHPDGVIVGRLATDRPAGVNFTLRHTSPRADFTATAADATLTVRGALADNGLRFEAQVRVRAQGGTVTSDADGTITVTGADSAWFVLAAGTDYADTYPDYRGPDPHAAVSRAVERAGDHYEALLARHVRDHQALFRRVGLDIGQSLPADLPTDRLLAAYTDGTSPADRALEALYFQYGRYLLIASSRPGSLPANLQGVWNNSTTPPWSADYHTNINIQMNYWPAEAANLAETTAPYDRFVEALRAPGRRTAKEMFGSRGWVVHNETNPYGFTGVHNWATAFWFPEAAAWLTQQMYEHYRFGGSTDYLRTTAYPVMKEAAEFWLDNLRTDPRDGTLVVTPSYSPEHGDFTAGAAMSQQIVHDLFTNTLEAARILGDTPDFRRRVEEALNRLDPGLHIGSWGQLQEWTGARAVGDLGLGPAQLAVAVAGADHRRVAERAVSVGVLLDDHHQEPVLEAHRAPDPVEALGRPLLGEPAALLPGYGAHTPAAVTGAGPLGGGDAELLTGGAHDARHAAGLYEAAPFEGEPVAAALEVVGFPEGGEVGGPGDVVRQFLVVARQTEPPERLLDLDPQRPDGEPHPVLAEGVRGPHGVQPVAHAQGRVRVGHPGVRVHPEAEDQQGAALVVEDVEDAAVVGVAVAGRDVLHGQRHLVHRVLVERDGAVVVGHGIPPWRRLG
ncbi:glycoside hydrolase N-terminal domain-containing protein, partial [Streptomyces sp. NPDC006356]